MNIKEFLNSEVLEVLKSLGYDAKDALVSRSNRPELSDYQSNAAMPLAKVAHKAPREVATKIATELEKKDFISKVSVDGPGFINMSLTDDFLANVPTTKTRSKGRTIMIDYGGPNIAKEMHVGHLRSAIIGESIKRIMRATGDKVIGDVHFGDWGTPIGMLIAQLQSEQPHLAYFTEPFKSVDFDISISEISALYRRAAANFKESDDFKEKARVATFELQKKRSGYIALWSLFHDKSVAAVKENYDHLGVDFDLWNGESDVNDLLPKLVDDLTQKGMAQPSQGALIVPLEAKNNHERAPLILKKSDGAYTYAATDLATLIQRMNDYHPDNILYVVDARQREHFDQVFEVARLAGIVPETTALEYIPFGTVNGADGKPFKTRSGGVMTLKALIELAVDKARETVPADADKNTTEAQAHKVALGALKFQDLKNARTSDYIFDTDNFTKSEGKTGAYLQYAVARINSILDKSGVTIGDIDSAQIKISHPLERELVLALRRFPESLVEAYIHREPSVIAEYVYTLAQRFSTLYAELSINGEKDENLKLSRLKIALLTRETLKQGLGLLAIECPDRMLKN
ncbi:MAG: arginine--tRNA ligase [Alphaproteobacteria bacterium]|nr:arginine--tRNA ligase [Alphaproteobacteria bacterium]